MVDDLDTTKQSLTPRPFVTSSYAQTLRMTDTSVTHYGVDLVLDGWIEYPVPPPMTVESEERVGCVTA